MSEEEKLHNELEENYEKIVEMLSNGNFLQLNGKAINLTELNEYINAQQEEIERLNNDFKVLKELQMKTNEENNRLNNIIDELEKYIGQEWYCFDNESVEHEVAKNILDKLKALKEGKE